jgi:hypothetical protein
MITFRVYYGVGSFNLEHYHVLSARLIIIFAFTAITKNSTSKASLVAFAIFLLAIRFPAIAPPVTRSTFDHFWDPIDWSLKYTGLRFKSKRVPYGYLASCHLDFMLMCIIIEAPAALAGRSAESTIRKTFAVEF